MYYTVYKITNNVNNKIYIGVHKTKDLEDNYMGSGKILKRAQEKYGIENFTKEYIKVFDNSEDMFNMEAELVNEVFISNESTYNLKLGGEGGFDLINTLGLNVYDNHNEITRKSLQKGTDAWIEKYANDEVFREQHYLRSVKALEEYRERNENPFKGKRHNEESRAKISTAKKGTGIGEGNSQFGSMWIHSLTEKVSKKISKEDFPTWEQDGWLKGRKMKF